MTNQEINKALPIIQAMTSQEIADGVAATSRLISTIQTQITKILKEIYLIESSRKEIQEKVGAYQDILTSNLSVNSAVIGDVKILIEDIRQYEQHVQALDGTTINLLNPDEIFLSTLAEFASIEPMLAAIDYAAGVGQVGKLFGQISGMAKINSEAMDRMLNIFDLALRLRAKTLKSIREAFVKMGDNATVLSNAQAILAILATKAISVQEFLSKTSTERMVIINESNT